MSRLEEKQNNGKNEESTIEQNFMMGVEVGEVLR